MQQLGTIGQALYMRAFFHFANLYDGRNRSRLSFQKRYDDICTEWLGGIAVVKHQSKIVERLGSHLDQLVAHGFLANYRITKAKADDQTGFVIAFRPGDGFFRDYDRYYRARLQGELQWDYGSDQRRIAEPLRVAYQFIEKRTGQKVTAQAYVSSKDVQTAKQLLAELTYEDIPAFLDYAFAEARRTNFDMQTLGGVRQYLAGYQAVKTAQKTMRVQEARAVQERQAEAERDSYERYRWTEVRRIDG